MTARKRHPSDTPPASLPPGLLIRRARPGDVPAIVKMIHELAEYERAPEQCHATDAAMQQQLFGPEPRAEALVAEMNGQVAAYAIFFHNFSTWESAPGLYLEDIYVRPAWRRLGIGRILLTALAALAKQRGCKRFEWAVLDWNKPSRDFYEKLGARPQSDWVIYRTEGGALDKLAGEGRGLLHQPEASGPPVPSSLPIPTARSGEHYIIHTDGGAQPNPGTGAWAAVVRLGDAVFELSGGEFHTTNNRMEMTAAIHALEAIPGERQTVEFHTDSQYLRNGITLWIADWKRNGWQTKARKPVLNDDLWRALDQLCQRHHVTWHWLRGHAGHVDNERCDALCAAKIAELQRARR